MGETCRHVRQVPPCCAPSQAQPRRTHTLTQQPTCPRLSTQSVHKAPASAETLAQAQSHQQAAAARINTWRAQQGAQCQVVHCGSVALDACCALDASPRRPSPASCLLRACLCLACCPVPCAWRLSTKQEKASPGACGIVSAASRAVLSVLRKSFLDLLSPIIPSVQSVSC